MNSRRSGVAACAVIFAVLLGGGCSSSNTTSAIAVDPTYRAYAELLAGTPTGQLRTLDRGDVDGDGDADVVIGGQSFAGGGNPGDEFEPVLLFRNDAGGGSFADITTQLVGTPTALADGNGNPKGHSPLARFADFNGDGKNDLAIFFWGYETRALDSAYLGRPPLIYLSQSSSSNLVYDATLSNAVKLLRESLVPMPRPCNVPYATTFGCDVFVAADGAITSLGIDGSELHAKAFDVGDIDGDGDLDITVETGGGFGTDFYLVAFINDGTGHFTAASNRFPVTALKGPPTAGSGLPCSAPNPLHGTWRHFAHRLVDVNADGSLDMVMAALRNVKSPYNCDHGTLRSKIFINDGTGTFFTPPTLLPNPEVYRPGVPPTEADRTFNGQAIAYGDLIGDPTPELVIVYTRSTDSAALNSTDWTSTGRYVQILKRASGGSWKDLTDQYLGGQDTTLVSRYPRVMSSDPVLAAILTHNHGDTRRVEIVDVNSDGQRDIVVSGFGGVVSEFAPLIYLNEGASFRAFNPPEILTHPYATATGLMALPFDVDGDGKGDWLFAGPLDGLSNPGSIGVFLGQ